MKKALLFLNGIPPANETLRKLSETCRQDRQIVVCCTDGAYRYLSPYMTPDILVGDFDSLERSEVSASCEIVSFGAEKDYTDGYLAMDILISRGYGDIDVYGAYGARPDMAEYNYSLLVLAHKRRVRAKLCGDTVTYLTHSNFSADVPVGATVSLAPFSDRLHIVYTRGLKYALFDYTMCRFDTVGLPTYVMGVSNQSTASHIEIGIDKGIALVFVSQICG